MIPRRHSDYENLPLFEGLPTLAHHIVVGGHELLKARDALKYKLHIATLALNTGVRSAVINALNSDDRLGKIREIFSEIASSYSNVADDSSTTELSTVVIREGLILAQYVALCLSFAAGST